MAFRASRQPIRWGIKHRYGEAVPGVGVEILDGIMVQVSYHFDHPPEMLTALLEEHA